MFVDIIRAKDIERYCGMNESILIDLRSSELFEESHIPTAVNIPYEDIDDFIAFISQYKQVILYCEKGNLSLLAARELDRVCQGRMYSITGGYNAYRQYQKLNYASMY